MRPILGMARQLSRRMERAERLATANVRVLPDFLVLGAMKAGTTSLFQWLEEHPSVAEAEVKEPHYFTLYWDKGERWYRAHFPTEVEMGARRVVRGRVLTGEATPYTLFHPLAPERVRRTVPTAKLIALLRDPVTRAWSHYRHERRHGREPLGFLEAIEAEPSRLSGEEDRILRDPRYVSDAHQRHSYVARGRYAEQLARWFRWFGPGQVLCVRSEDLFEEPARVWRQVLDFLELPHEPIKSATNRGAGGGERLDHGVAQQVAARFRDENQKLEELLKRSMDWTS
ncbi:MAG: sulfotransferase domain-containing protein [Deltaproteobacteria bacterium]|nr:sulfotransferase domain-containing protein [Deltaproteobacteria bacterium]